MAKAYRKVQIAIDKIIDLREDFHISERINSKALRILDSLRELETEVDSENPKRKR